MADEHLIRVIMPTGQVITGHLMSTRPSQGVGLVPSLWETNCARMDLTIEIPQEQMGAYFEYQHGNQAPTQEPEGWSNEGGQA